MKISGKLPCAGQIPVEHHLHGEKWVDEFGWLRADNWQACVDEPELLPEAIKEYLDQENAWCEFNMADTVELQATLLGEMRGRIEADDDSLPDEEGPWSYFERYIGDEEYPSYWRIPRQGRESDVRVAAAGKSDLGVSDLDVKGQSVASSQQNYTQEQLLIDFNVESDGHEYYSPGDVEYSSNHAWLAWSVDTVGAERYCVYIRNLETGVDEDIINDVESITWGDDRYLFYTRVDSEHRPNQVYRHEQGADPADDVLVFEEQDSRFFCSIWTSLSGRYVFISTDMNDQSEVWYIPCDDMTSEPVLIESRTEDLEYSVEHQGDRFLILTNADGASDYKIMQTPCATPSRRYWRDWLPSQEGRMVLDVYAYQDWIMWMEREDALPRICYARSSGAIAMAGDLPLLETASVQRIDFDEEAYALSLEPLLEFDETRFRFGYESPSTPEQTWSFDLETGERSLLKQELIPSGHDPENYVVRRLYAESADGEQVPLTVLHHKKTPLDGTAPCLLTGYGAYGSSSPATFSASLLSLIDRGFVHVVAHVRGGQEKGRAWYDAARFSGKHRSIDDLIGVAEYLVAQNYTSAGRIVLSGASAGGLLVGAALNRETDLWGGAIAGVPFVDVLHTLLDENLPLTPGEWSQWGNPKTDPQAFADIRSYCPYMNVQARAYPPMLVTAGISDARVTYWEPAKWVARHRQRRVDTGAIYLKTNMTSGHFGETGRYASLAEYALEQAFALKIMSFCLTAR
ncbi:S9 family peptidase [Granulosicoccus antarcticus]|uniref:Dipeptidyl aminopeptidase BI n=1 Tax=Granulosicoccus antarcticus IMCC3135 TaxID=1192854 RepID=A0A2Z2NWI4_9GAMM|nr:S9 family peptidase [Granulosicoccus antarcticus]ASJ71504.1 Dipeptidyl aminopeptidase BI [Granulosicoccus antarcticus IMCC3135]